MPRVLIIYNPLAGRGRGKHFAQLTNYKLKQQNWNVLGVIATQHAGHAEKEIVPDWCQQVDIFVVVAGDGTLREVVTGLLNMKSTTSLGFVPLGNANVVAREFGIPLNPVHAIDGIAGYEARNADVGVCRFTNQTQCYFLAMVEVGQGARIVHLVDHLRHGTFKRLYRWWGDLVYVIACLMVLKNQNKVHFSVTVENHVQYEACQRAVFSCMATYSKGWSMTPDARFDDGKLDFVTSQRSGVIAFISQMLASARRKKIRRSWVQYGIGERFEISSQIPMCIQADGDPVTESSSLQLEVIPSAYQILAPPSSAPRGNRDGK